MTRSSGEFVFALALLCAGPAGAEPGAFTPAAAGCPMAHCDARMSGRVNVVSPTSASLIGIDVDTLGSKAGLGCVSNTRTVACTNGGDPLTQSNLVVYDASGHRLWEDHGVLGPSAWMSVPILARDGSLIATDQDWILRADPAANRIVWQSRKPDAGFPISPVLVGADDSMVLLTTNSSGAGSTAELSVWDVATGALLSHQPIIDPVTGRLYVTRNTAAVRGNRAYVLTAAELDETDGRLYAIDICGSATCGGRGAVTLSWHHDFKGPSSSSPLLIGSRLFFDGRSGVRGGTFTAVADDGDAPRLVWKQPFSARFVVSAAQDPRGGLWVYPALTDALLRLNPQTGAIDQKVVMSQALGLAPGYTPASVVSVSASPAGAVVLLVGAQARNEDGPTYVAAVDVGSTPAGSALWKYEVAPTGGFNVTPGQFPLVVAPSGARRIVFRGSNSSIYFVGEP